MADLGENASASEISENIGDVLASIRRLIAQDEANRSVTDPGQRLRQVAIEQAAIARQTAPQPAPQPQNAPQPAPRRMPQAPQPPLMLGDQELIARQGSARQPLPRPRPANEAVPLRMPQAVAPQPEAAPLRPAAPVPHRASERRLPEPPPMQPSPQRPEHLSPPEPRPFQQRDMRPEGRPAPANPAPLHSVPAAKLPPAPTEIMAEPAPIRNEFAPEHGLHADDHPLAPLPHDLLQDRDFAPERATEPAHTYDDAAADEGLSFAHVGDEVGDEAEEAAALECDESELHLFAPTEEEIPADRLLRDLIRAAVREELQGELGGQFSRNLRRLVRAEIDRALRQNRRIA